MLLFAGLYALGWLPTRLEKSLQTGVRMTRAEWHHRADDGRRLPRGQRR